LNLSFAFKYDKICSFIRKQKSKVWQIHQKHKDEYNKAKIKFEKKFVNRQKKFNEKVDKKYAAQRDLLDSLAPAKILAAIEREEDGEEAFNHF
jgi:hypothetical protein